MVQIFILMTLTAYFVLTAGFEKIDQVAFARKNRKAQAAALEQYFPIGG